MTPLSRPQCVNAGDTLDRRSLILEKLRKESEEHEKSKKELTKLNKKLCDKQNEIVKLRTDFQKMKRRNGVLEEENRLRKQKPGNTDNSTNNINEVSFISYKL